jgi:alpha-glucosidase
MLVGEVYLPIERLMTYYGKAGGDGVHMPFNFQLVTLPWNASAISTAIHNYEKALPSYGWPNWVLGNHDNPRIASRAGRDQTRVAAMLLLTLRGTPTLYYGDEIGMADVPIAPHQVQDPFEKNVPGMGLGRDPERSPMAWDASPNCGFTSGQPWLPLADDCVQRNVAVQQNEPRSLLSLYRKLIELRRAEPALHRGQFEPIASNDQTIVYLRSYSGRCFLIALNLSHEPQSIEPTDRRREPAYGRIVLSTHLDRADQRVAGTIVLRANEGIIVEWTRQS